jgi:ABC-type Na+ efflux pump permease subunit
MNIPLQTIITKEMKTMISKKYLISLLFSFIIAASIIYYLCNSFTDTINFNTPIAHSIFQILLIISIIMVIVTFIMQYLFEINKEKINKRIELMLTSPISISNIIHGKLISLLIAYYIISICWIIILTILFQCFHINIIQIMTAEIGLMILVIMPLFMVLYASVLTWLSLRFDSNVNSLFIILTGFIIAPAIFLGKYLDSLGILKFLTDGFIKGNVITQSILLYSSLILIIGFIVIFIAIKKLNKEKIT